MITINIEELQIILLMRTKIDSQNFGLRVELGRALISPEYRKNFDSASVTM